jgi:thiol-disulfide isomerase/thioredoxin
LFFFDKQYFHYPQQSYYKIKNGKAITEKEFEKISIEISKIDFLKIDFYETIAKKDSIIKEFKITQKDEYNPYLHFEKKIGTVFKIEDFKDIKNVKYDPNYLIGKPTLIGFWFTKCPPCIDEIPCLNNIQSRFKDSVNFIAITFDTEIKVKEFLKSNNLNFEHIVNSNKQLKKIGIKAYPMNLLLDKNAIIVDVYGQIIFFEKEVIEKLQKLL